jgi:hypothetical protein
MAELTVTELLAAFAGGGALTVGALIAARWGRFRRVLGVIEALTGRPERYPGDPEARPSLPQRLDSFDARLARIEWHVGNGSERPLRDVVDTLEAELARFRRKEQQT